MSTPQSEIIFCLIRHSTLVPMVSGNSSSVAAISHGRIQYGKVNSSVMLMPPAMHVILKIIALPLVTYWAT